MSKDEQKSANNNGMDVKSWVAIIGAISSALIAVLVSLYQLGPAAPGVVLGLLMCCILTLVIITQAAQITNLIKESHKREEIAATQSEKVILAIQAVVTINQRLVEEQGIQATLLKWRAESSAMALAESTKAVAREAVTVAKELKDAKPTE